MIFQNAGRLIFSVAMTFDWETGEAGLHLTNDVSTSLAKIPLAKIAAFLRAVNILNFRRAPVQLRSSHLLEGLSCRMLKLRPCCALC